MSQPLRSENHSGSTRILILRNIEEKIRGSFEDSKEQAINNICVKHRAATNSVMGFRYGTGVYRHSQMGHTPSYKFKRLHPSLAVEFDELLASWEHYNEHHSQVMSAVRNVLMQCASDEEFKQYFPECVHDCLTEEPHWVGRSRPALLRETAQENAVGLEHIKVQLAMNMLR